MRDYTKFFTPEDKARFMASLADPKDGQVWLEPAAGKGALCRALKEYNPKCIIIAFEINPDHEDALRDKTIVDVCVIQDFLKQPVFAKYCGCIANPPFGNGIDIDYWFKQMCSHIKKGGTLVTILPRDYFPDLYVETWEIENWSKNSDGTTTEIKIIRWINI